VRRTTGVRGVMFRGRGPDFEGVTGSEGTSTSARLMNCKGVRPAGESCEPPDLKDWGLRPLGVCKEMMGTLGSGTCGESTSSGASSRVAELIHFSDRETIRGEAMSAGMRRNRSAKWSLMNLRQRSAGATIRVHVDLTLIAPPIRRQHEPSQSGNGGSDRSTILGPDHRSSTCHSGLAMYLPHARY
jgi:hypothetical protein